MPLLCLSISSPFYLHELHYFSALLFFFLSLSSLCYFFFLPCFTHSCVCSLSLSLLCASRRGTEQFRTPNLKHEHPKSYWLNKPSGGRKKNNLIDEERTRGKPFSRLLTLSLSFALAIFQCALSLFLSVLEERLLSHREWPRAQKILRKRPINSTRERLVLLLPPLHMQWKYRNVCERRARERGRRRIITFFLSGAETKISIRAMPFNTQKRIGKREERSNRRISRCSRESGSREERKKIFHSTSKVNEIIRNYVYFCSFSFSILTYTLTHMLCRLY